MCDPCKFRRDLYGFIVLASKEIYKHLSLTGCGDLDIGDLDLYRFWRQLSQMLTNFDKIKTNKDKY